MSGKTTIFSARKIITLSPSRPTASHIAVRGDRILGVGSLRELAGWGDYELDERFQDKVITPGFVEGHSHVQEGSIWRHVYVGYFDRRDPNGRLWPGLKSIEEVVARLREAEAALSGADEALVAWGFDPIYFDNRRMHRRDLDAVSESRPVLVIHSSFHVLNANGVVLQRAGVDGGTEVEGLLKGVDGQPTGELQEMAAMFMAFEAAEVQMFEDVGSATGLRDFGRLAQLAGVTTVTDLYNPLSDEVVDCLAETTAEPDFPVRVVPAYNALLSSPEEGIERIRMLQPRNTAKLRIGIVKMMTDGSIQGFTARLKWPGYFNGAANGLWNAPPQELTRLLMEYHRAGLQVHIHANGDEASELMIDAIETALSLAPRWDHRHTLQHCQMMTEAQLRRAAALGICVNMFANHIYYWGEEHLAQTLGPGRANRLEPFASALRLGVPFAMHSDAPVTPIGPLFTAWCSVERQTAKGRILGSEERIPVPDALRAITLGAAYTLKMDHLVGSLETGKLADFTILEEDPLETESERLKDIGIWGTVLGGSVFESPARL